jgi:hypothetical protein
MSAGGGGVMAIQETGETQVNLRKVAEWAHVRLGMPLPLPRDPLDVLAEQFAQAARE